MQLFDTTGTEYYRNILWIIGLAVVGFFITCIYNEAVKREELEATYDETIGDVKSAERWRRTRTRNGRVESTNFFFKFKYQYFVNGKLFSGSAQQEDEPSDVVLIYYNPRNPSEHVLEPKSSEIELAILVIGGIVILILTGVNVWLYKKKKKKIFGVD